MADKCKSDLDHVNVVPAAQSGVTPDGPGVWTITVVTDGTCSNDRTYTGPLYVMTRLGEQKMKCKPELAQALVGRLRAAAAVGPCAQFRHKVAGLWVNVRRMKLTAAGALDLADRLEAATT